ncbi:hypothetical protein [Telmatospirillum sp.]|uniref:hypothetical protein n=1 Tax=Telmatospirillum sp. TaxID=2079197 RepID=UPI0028469227|nr:hypothetical protein [Telmatospirillum sp.]MDR3435026.1 hypothetical protein [Telmatospirillum sp.]
MRRISFASIKNHHGGTEITERACPFISGALNGLRDFEPSTRQEDLRRFASKDLDEPRLAPQALGVLVVNNYSLRRNTYNKTCNNLKFYKL